MTPKERYRQRLKLQAAFARVLKVLADNSSQQIPPDQTTGELAVQLIVWLTRYTIEAGVEMPKLAEGPDLDRYLYLTKSRVKETRNRKKRTIRKRKNGAV